MMKILAKLYNIFFISKFEKRLFNKYKTDFNKNKPNKDIVLIQCVEDYFYFGIFAETIRYIKTKKDINVELYTARCLTVGSTFSLVGFIKSVLFNNRLRDNKWINLYKCYCDGIAYRHEGSTSILFDLKAFFKAKKIFNNIKTKKDVLALSIDNINLGEQIYDSYLRFKPAPTVDINDIYLLIIIWQAIRNKYLAENYFKNNKIKFVLNTYTSYIQHGITAKVALRYNIPVYTFGNVQSVFKNITIDNFYHTNTFDFYKKEFEELKEKEKYLNMSKEALEKRLQGFKDTATFYMKQSAYKETTNDVPNVEGHVVIFMHDFYDSVYNYGNVLFVDFIDWIEFTIKFLDENDIPYILKPHPNQIDDSAKIIDKLKIKYPKAKFISSSITNKQLVDAKVQVGLSVYGTVAHELVYMGIPVILCGKNPHSSYNFCYEAKTMKEYTDLIKNFKELKVPENSKYEVESFYYMHNLNIKPEDVKLLRDMADFREVSHIKSDKEQYEFFIKQIDLIKNNSAFYRNLEKII